ncbi:MAG: cupin domain-containing protein [Verrucomicrobia bacterium]|nr:cupin domain-containing protein [Verrucomicrobiota bacterium]MBV9274949.1 cupin domain-containing protein [Verrucomicrobiota bacterium]
MNISNIYRASTWFEVLQTNELSQTAVMTLKPGQATGAEAESHKEGQQVLLLIIGKLAAEVAGEVSNLSPGDVVLIPPGTKHKFTNHGTGPAVTFNVYSPPVYPPDEKD